jgi:hypothetical protein
MTLTYRHTYLALLSTLGLPACTAPKGGDTDGSTATTATTTTDGADPTDVGTNGPEPTTSGVGDSEVYEHCKANDVDAVETSMSGVEPKPE